MPEPGWCATRTCPATTLVMASRSGKPSEGQLTRKAPSRSSKNSLDKIREQAALSKLGRRERFPG